MATRIVITNDCDFCEEAARRRKKDEEPIAVAEGAEEDVWVDGELRRLLICEDHRDTSLYVEVQDLAQRVGVKVTEIEKLFEKGKKGLRSVTSSGRSTSRKGEGSPRRTVPKEAYCPIEGCKDADRPFEGTKEEWDKENYRRGLQSHLRTMHPTEYARWQATGSVKEKTA